MFMVSWIIYISRSKPNIRNAWSPLVCRTMCRPNCTYLSNNKIPIAFGWQYTHLYFNLYSSNLYCNLQLQFVLYQTCICTQTIKLVFQLEAILWGYRSQILQLHAIEIKHISFNSMLNNELRNEMVFTFHYI